MSKNQQVQVTASTTEASDGTFTAYAAVSFDGRTRSDTVAGLPAAPAAAAVRGWLVTWLNEILRAGDDQAVEDKLASFRVETPARGVAGAKRVGGRSDLGSE